MIPRKKNKDLSQKIPFKYLWKKFHYGKKQKHFLLVNNFENHHREMGLKSKNSKDCFCSMATRVVEFSNMGYKIREMDLQISIVYHFLSLEHVVQYIHAEEPEMIKISKKTLVRSKVRKRFRNQKPISNIEIYCLKYFRLFRQTEPKSECKEFIIYSPDRSFHD